MYFVYCLNVLFYLRYFDAFIYPIGFAFDNNDAVIELCIVTSAKGTLERFISFSQVYALETRCSGDV